MRLLFSSDIPSALKDLAFHNTVKITGSEIIQLGVCSVTIGGVSPGQFLSNLFTFQGCLYSVLEFMRLADLKKVHLDPLTAIFFFLKVARKTIRGNASEVR